MRTTTIFSAAALVLLTYTPLIAKLEPLIAPDDVNVSLEEAEAIATEAYIYGYPLVLMDLTRQVMTNVAKPTEMKAPMGQFANARTYPNASFRDVTTPNADTLYSSAWLDLSKEPYILHVPDEKGRYYLMPILTGWTDVYADIGTRTSGTRAGQFGITGPSWSGNLPPGVIELKSPTNMVWIIGRTYCTGTPQDYEAVHEIQDQYTLTPLSAYGKPYKPHKGVVDPNLDMNTAVRDQVNSMDAGTFFNRLSHLLRDNPPTEKDTKIIKAMAEIKIKPGKDFDIITFEEDIKASIRKGAEEGLNKIKESINQHNPLKNGWLINLYTGRYGAHYLPRASVAYYGLGANIPQDAVYPKAEVDSEGKPFSGANKYVIHFPKGQLPPARGFWSITMYNEQYFFVENPLNRYSISPRNDLKINEDGSLDLYIQHDSPGSPKESNWLPAPAGPFVLIMRLYWPENSVLEGIWNPPPVQKVEVESTSKNGV